MEAYVMVKPETLGELTGMIKDLKEQINQLAQEKNVDPANKVYTNAGIQELLGVKDKLVRKYRDDGLLPFHKVGDKFWYTQQDVEEFLARSYVPAYA